MTPRQSLLQRAPVEYMTWAQMIAIEPRLKELLAERVELKSRCRMTAQKYFSLEGGAEKYRLVYRGLSNNTRD